MHTGFMRTALLLVLPIVALMGCNPLGDKPYANMTPDPPVCPAQCEANYYCSPNPAKPGCAWECDPIDPKVTPPGACMPWNPDTNCFQLGIACGQDAYCCSGVCGFSGVCEACRAESEPCVNDCCAGLSCVDDPLAAGKWCQ